MIASTIQEHFEGKVAEFLSQDTTYLAGYDAALSSIFPYLNAIDQHLLALLAKSNQPSLTAILISHTVSDLANHNISRSDVINSLTRLNDRSLIEPIEHENTQGYTLSRIVRKYVLLALNS